MSAVAWFLVGVLVGTWGVYIVVAFVVRRLERIIEADLQAWGDAL